MLEQLRKKNPVILNIANMVTPQRVADAINFIGGSPIMFTDQREADDLVKISNALVINLGSTNENEIQNAIQAGKFANQKGIPIVVDPVAIAASKLRQNNFKRLINAVHITLLRGNAGEIAWIAGKKWTSKGIDAGNGAGNLGEIVKTTAQKLKCIAVLSGPHDFISDDTKTFELKNGHHYFAVNVGSGDMLDGILGTFLAVSNSLNAALIATLTFSIAGEMAAKNCPNQPYSFITALFNILGTISDQNVNHHKIFNQI